MKKGDLVRIKQSSGKLSTQRYQVEKIGEACACWITQWPSEGKPAWERFDTSLLVVDNSGPKALAKLFAFAVFGLVVIGGVSAAHAECHVTCTNHGNYTTCRQVCTGWPGT